MNPHQERCPCWLGRGHPAGHGEQWRLHRHTSANTLVRPPSSRLQISAGLRCRLSRFRAHIFPGSDLLWALAASADPESTVFRSRVSANSPTLPLSSREFSSKHGKLLPWLEAKGTVAACDAMDLTGTIIYVGTAALVNYTNLVQRSAGNKLVGVLCPANRISK